MSPANALRTAYNHALQVATEAIGTRLGAQALHGLPAVEGISIEAGQQRQFFVAVVVPSRSQSLSQAKGDNVFLRPDSNSCGIVKDIVRDSAEIPVTSDTLRSERCAFCGDVLQTPNAGNSCQYCVRT